MKLRSCDHSDCRRLRLYPESEASIRQRQSTRGLPVPGALRDEDELEAELNALAQESLEDGLGTLDESALDLPSVPQKGLPAGVKAGAAKQPAADPFDSLQMEMNM